MTIDEFSKHLIERSVTSLSEKYGEKCPKCGKSPCECGKEKEEVKEAKNKEGKEQGVDGKACWKGYKYAGTENGKDKCVKAGYEMEGGEDLAERKDMPGNQEKIDANKNGKVDAHDFALLRARKGKKSVKEMWEIAEAKNKTKIEVMPTIDDNPTEQGEKESSEISSDAKNSKYDSKKKKMKEEVEHLEEKKLSKAETAKKEKFVKGMKKKFGSFKSKYGEKAKEVMYGTATSMAKKKA